MPRVSFGHSRACSVSWLRVDDRFASHPKMSQLSDKEFRVWVKLLCFCAAYQDPSVDQVALNEVPGLSSSMVTKFGTAGLLDIVGEAFEIHDWEKFQPKDATGAERQARWRARNAVRNAVRNGLQAVE